MSHLLFPLITNIMAIIKSMGVGRSRKSMGNVTYRVVRGRTIGSQKRGSSAAGAATRGQAGNFRKPLFSMINMFMKEHQTDINVSFNRSKYGSQRNYFFSTNYGAFSKALMALAIQSANSGILPSMEDINTAINSYAVENPTSILRVKLAGFENVYLTGEWNPEDNPVAGGSADGLGTGTAKLTASVFTYTAPALLSMGMHSGARIAHEAGTVTLTGNAIAEGLTAAQIIYMNASGAVTPAVEVSDVNSKAGSVSYTAPKIEGSDNIVAVQLGSVFFRLSSAYTKEEEDEDLTA